MRRKLVGGAVLLVAALVAVWLFWWRGRGDGPANAAPDPAASRSAKVEPTPVAAKPDDQRSAQLPRGRAPRWSLDVDPEGSLRLEGQVLGADGKGAGGAEVWLSSVPPRSTKADDDGSFTFDKLVGRTYQLRAKSGDAIGGPIAYKLTAGSDPAVIRLVEGATIVVTVVDEAQKPIAGAEVRGAAVTERTAVRTDAKGEATLRPVHPGYVAVAASATGYAESGGFTTIGSPGATGRLTITLRKGFPVSGRVVDEAGKPVAKARITVGGAWWTRDDHEADDDEVDRATISDDKGLFTVPALPAGTHRLHAFDGVHAPATSEPVAVIDHAVTGVTITLKEGGAVRGRVVDGADKPVPYAAVRIAGTGRQMWSIAARQATTDAEGAFEVRGLPREKLSARAESETASSAMVDVDLTATALRKDLVLKLDVTGTIAGKVVDDTGAPVAEIQVNALPDLTGGEGWDGIAMAGMASAMSAGDGTFVVHGLRDGAYRLWATRGTRGGFEWGQHGVTAKTGDKGVVIKLPTPGGIKGKIVIDGAGAPRYAMVQIAQQAPTPAKDGVFEVKDAAPGTHDVTFRGGEFAELVKRDVVIAPGKITDLGTITVSRGRRLTGRVVDKAGRGIAGAKVRLGEMLFSVEGQEDTLGGVEDLSGIRSTVSGGDGEFVIIGLPPKPTTAAAEHANHGRSQPVAIPEGVEDPPPLTLTLRGFGSISGKVVQKGAPVPNVTITESTKGGGAQLAFARTDEAGAFTLAKVAEGPHVLQAMLQSGPGSMKSTSVTVNVVAGQDTKVTIDVPVGNITLAVQPKAIAGASIDAAQVFLFSGSVSLGNGDQLFQQFLQGGAQGVKVWYGPGKPTPEFPELVPADYSVCTLPVNGDILNESFVKRLQDQRKHVKVYCKLVKVTAAPLKQTITHEVPAMEPLPAP